MHYFMYLGKVLACILFIWIHAVPPSVVRNWMHLVAYLIDKKVVLGEDGTLDLGFAFFIFPDSPEYDLPYFRQPTFIIYKVLSI